MSKIFYWAHFCVSKRFVFGFVVGTVTTPILSRVGGTNKAVEIISILYPQIKLFL